MPSGTHARAVNFSEAVSENYSTKRSQVLDVSNRFVFKLHARVSVEAVI